MLINQEYDYTTSTYKASTQWMTPEWNSVTTFGTSKHGFAEAIGNMIIQMSACAGSPVVLTFTDHEGVITLQPKL